MTMTTAERHALLATLAEAVGGIHWDRFGLSSLFLVTDENGSRDWNPLAIDQDTQQVARHFGLCVDYGRLRVHYSVGDLQCTRTSSWPETLALRVCLAGADVAKQEVHLIDGENLALRHGNGIVVLLPRQADTQMAARDLLRWDVGVRKALTSAGIPLSEAGSERPTNHGLIACETLPGDILQYTWRPAPSHGSKAPCLACNDNKLLPVGASARCWACGN